MIESGTAERTVLVRAGPDTRYISLETVSLGPAARVELPPGEERVAVVMSGRVDVSAGAHPLGRAGAREDVFQGPGDAVYLPAGEVAVLQARDGPASVAVASAPPSGRPGGPARLIRGGEQRTLTVGRATWARSVRTILGPDDAASRLLVGETVNEPGLWSSYPPHRHDRESAEEVALEEVYLYRLQPAHGFGVQVRYEDGVFHEARMVRDGDVAVISSGFHPVAAAPGYRLYYLWVMAGEGRVMRPFIDPRHRWVDAPT